MSAISSPTRLHRHSTRTRPRANSDNPQFINDVPTLCISFSFPSTDAADLDPLNQMPNSPGRSLLTGSSSFSDLTEDVTLFNQDGADVVVFDDGLSGAPCASTSASALNNCPPSPSASNRSLSSSSQGKPSSPRVMAGNLSGLIFHLANKRTQDQQFVEQFLLTCDYFVPAEELLNILLVRFDSFLASRSRIDDGLDVPSEDMISVYSRLCSHIMARLLSVLRTWVELRPYDFPHGSPTRLRLDQHILSMLNSPLPNLTDWALSFRTTQRYMQLAQRHSTKAKHRSFESPSSSVCVSPVASRLKPNDPSCVPPVYKYGPKVVAQQMSLIDSTLFHAITVPEFFQGNWQQDKDPSLAPNIVALTQRFNQVSFWITSEILSTPTPERRLYNMIFFLDVAHTCLAHRSFHTAMAILAALTNSAVQRIKSLWAALPPEKKEIFDELSDTLSNEQNFKRYRRVLKTASGSVLPFMGVFLQDVTFALQNSPETPSGLINWQRYSVLGSIFVDLIQYQRALHFPFAKIPELSSYLKRVEGLKQEQLFIMSRFLQGRVARASPPPSSSSSSSSSSQSNASRLRHQALSASAPVPVVSPISLGNSEPVSPFRSESLTPPASGRRFSIFQFKRAGSKDSDLNPPDS